MISTCFREKWRFFAAFGALILIICASILTVVLSESPAMLKTEKLVIKTTWNNRTVPKDEEVTVSMTLDEKHLLIDVEAKFYDDPTLPNSITNPGTHTTLYDFEVVELFLLGPNDHYLEIELGPKGQYYVIELHGERNAIRYPIEIHDYRVNNDGKGRWSARAFIDRKELPDNINKLNAYAIHGSNENRVYMALYPAPENSPDYPQPDFHKLNLFQSTGFFKI